ncbi:unnamed protein product [Acanthoscelides obtectus]|uniref:Uncharacterized protein n=1 Tax=Acanthoscelides obtectus TaxID=200917 RepID=A0A9P0KL01_ACAOB|nr:unnamed protein product [Acanthoscelides obtectus]CAK1647153.1 hypothetical protein AOBTE_LOCUS15078 [Acanthoscelides obtectus]
MEIMDRLKIDSNCESCARLFSLFVTEKHLIVTFKEHDEEKRLKYSGEDLINLIDLLDEKLYAFLEQHGTEDQLELNLNGSIPASFKITAFVSSIMWQKVRKKAARLGICKYLFCFY